VTKMQIYTLQREETIIDTFTWNCNIALMNVYQKLIKKTLSAWKNRIFHGERFTELVRRRMLFISRNLRR